MVSLFDASVRAVNEMASARTSGDLLTELVKRLSMQFSRVALFRVKRQASKPSTTSASKTPTSPSSSCR